MINNSCCLYMVAAKKFGDENQMLNREKNVQECDARKLNSSNEVWLQKNY